MNDFGMILILAVIGMALLLMGYNVGKNDNQNNTRWDECQTKYEQSGIPHEGRESFMRGCFE